MKKFADLTDENSVILHRFRVQVLDSILRIQPSERVNRFPKRAVLEVAFPG